MKMSDQPPYLPGDDKIVVKFLKDLIIMNWDVDGSFKIFQKGKLYQIPTEIALELSKQKYCYYVEGLK